LLTTARRCARQYTRPPSSTKPSAPPTTLIRNSSGCASSPGGTIATPMAKRVTASPLNPTSVATTLPPGTRTASGGAGVRRWIRNEMKR
jgi:hypothetical protein